MIHAYRVRKSNIVHALNDMNSPSDFHHPKVLRVDADGDTYIVFVESDTSYPYRENEWITYEK